MKDHTSLFLTPEAHAAAALLSNAHASSTHPCFTGSCRSKQSRHACVLKSTRHAALFFSMLLVTSPWVHAQGDPPIAPKKARIHYYRPDGNYAPSTLYPFFATTDSSSSYCGTSELPIAGHDSYGVYFDVDTNPSIDNGQLGFIIHNCATSVKDPGPDQHLQINQYNEAWVISGDTTVYLTTPTQAQLLNGVFSQQQAFWIDRNHILIQPGYYHSDWTYALNGNYNGGIHLSGTSIVGGTQFPLVKSGALTADELARYPQLASYVVLTSPTGSDPALISLGLKGQLALSATSSDGTLRYATGLQTAGVLDDLFAYTGKLGVLYNDTGDGDAAPLKLKLWAPTAQSVSVQLYEHASDTTPLVTLPMTEKNGVWTADGDQRGDGLYYLYAVTVYVPSVGAVVTNLTTDPYSVDVAINSTKSRVTNLDADATKPAGWDTSTSPALNSLSDLSLYELHIRDFSIGDATVPANLRGTYDAFALPTSAGMTHLTQLAQAGMKAVHLLPSFDFASINEDKATWQTTPDLSTFAPASDQQQAAVAAVQAKDGYNWGYDPIHYMAPEGSYALNPDTRVKEYRTMVQGLHSAGLRVVQDVVFNHTNAAGQNTNSNLDEVVPGYYHRLDANGTLEMGSCCADTASEHLMMEKLMVDTLVLNATRYKIDGFRFDIMSFHFLYNMQHIKDALAALTPEKDGIDGSKIYLYGEGFNFGDTANSQIGPNASQVNLYGYGIGTFNDRIRDGIRGGSPFTDERVQGFATGMFTDPSSYTSSTTAQANQQTTVLQDADWIRVGLTGNLRDYEFTDYTGKTVTGAQVDYYGQHTGYTATPIEAVNYDSIHDNQDLFDAIQLKTSATDTEAIRARRQVLAMSLLTLGQAPPIYFAGDDLLRSKDMDQNSYDSGDWFNKIDWSGQGNNWGIGLPLASQNQGQWDLMTPLLSNASYTPTPAEITGTGEIFQDFLKIRYSSGLFHMQTFDEVQRHLSFLNTGQGQTPGLIVMKLDGAKYGAYKHIVVVFNAMSQQQVFTDSRLRDFNLKLHPNQQNGADPVVQAATFNAKAGSATVPALTTAVFVN